MHIIFIYFNGRNNIFIKQNQIRVYRKFITNSQTREQKYMSLNRTLPVVSKDKYGNIALMLAARRGYTKTVEYLFKHGVSLSEKNNNSNTALMLAAYHGHMETVEWLLGHEASLSEKNNNGDTALLLATYNGYTKIVERLFKQGASLIEKNNYKNTALLLAVWKGHTETVEWLLKSGAGIGGSIFGHTSLPPMDKKIWKNKVIVGLSLNGEKVEEMPEATFPGAIRTIDELDKKKNHMLHYDKLIKVCNQLLETDPVNDVILQLRKKLFSQYDLKTRCLMFFNRSDDACLKRKVLESDPPLIPEELQKLMKCLR